eukprot:TRINITY_DN9064_c0_g1_i1.p1 TRINITY_DN9064_c0_g1~~TRINITY_DN9064_c0_g1_i1.p1  ORF type:complete len:169 (-),score=14.70 TRINITY_DN9064_c0_g1_i1:36-542(-)
MDHANKVESEPMLDSILILQCIKCQTIVGDTMSFISSDTDTLTLRLASAVLVDDELKISKEDVGYGCTYLNFRCGGCRSYLGRIYKTTPVHWDHLRELYTFDTSLIQSYQVGSGFAAGSVSDVQMEQFNTNMFSVQSDLNSIKSMVLLMHERISNLEALQSERNGNTY